MFTPINKISIKLSPPFTLWRTLRVTHHDHGPYIWTAVRTISPKRESTCVKPDDDTDHDDADDDYTDGRKRWEWESRYPAKARKKIKCEAYAIFALLSLSILISSFFLSVTVSFFVVPLFDLTLHISSYFISAFFIGFVGGTTYSMKWFVHTVAKGQWHVDRRYWRFLTPLSGGVYSCVILAFSAENSVTMSLPANPNGSLSLAMPFAFLIGYFSDRVSGLLSNVANAAFGTLQKSR